MYVCVATCFLCDVANLGSTRSFTHFIATVANALQAVGIIVYRVFFHPLAKYPGPFLAKITDAYQLYHAYKGDRHLEFWRMHEKYGMLSCARHEAHREN